MILFALFLMFSPIIVQTWDELIFHTSISCRHTHRPNFDYQIQFYEEDDLGLFIKDDPVTSWFGARKIQGGGQKYRVNYFAQAEGDTGPEYEFGARIKHNCLLNRAIEDVKVLFTQNYCQVRGGNCHVYLSLDLAGLLEGSKRQVRIVQRYN